MRAARSAILVSARNAWGAGRLGKWRNVVIEWRGAFALLFAYFSQEVRTKNIQVRGALRSRRIHTETSRAIGN